MGLRQLRIRSSWYEHVQVGSHLQLNHQTRAASRVRDQPPTTGAEKTGIEDNGGMAPAHPLRLRLLGDFLLMCGDEVIEISSARIQSLLAYLELHREAAQTRQQIAFLFWPDSSEAQARNNLRQLVHQLRWMLPDVNRWPSADATRLAWQREVDLG